MQLPGTLSPAICCLLTLAVQHVAGLAVPKEAPGVGAEVGVKASLTGSGAHRGPTVEAEVIVEGDASLKAEAQDQASLTGDRAYRRQAFHLPDIEAGACTHRSRARRRQAFHLPDLESNACT